MSLNKQNGNMYEWVTHTWNPLGGACPHQCRYCYVEDMKRFPNNKKKYSGPPMLIEKELEYDHGEGKSIFVCDMHDLFAEDIKGETIRRVLAHTKNYPKNTYLFQSKNPARFIQYARYFTSQTILCTTLESNRDYTDTMAPRIKNRVKAMMRADILRFSNPGLKLFITVEPVMDFDFDNFTEKIFSINPDMVSIGADSKKCGLLEPSPEKLGWFIKWLRVNYVVHLKSNLKRFWVV